MTVVRVVACRCAWPIPVDVHVRVPLGQMLPTPKAMSKPAAMKRTPIGSSSAITASAAPMNGAAEIGACPRRANLAQRQHEEDEADAVAEEADQPGERGGAERRRRRRALERGEAEIDRAGDQALEHGDLSGSPSESLRVRLLSSAQPRHAPAMAADRGRLVEGRPPCQDRTRPPSAIAAMPTTIRPPNSRRKTIQARSTVSTPSRLSSNDADEAALRRGRPSAGPARRAANDRAGQPEPSRSGDAGFPSPLAARQTPAGAQDEQPEPGTEIEDARQHPRVHLAEQGLGERRARAEQNRRRQRQHGAPVKRPTARTEEREIGHGVFRRCHLRYDDRRSAINAFMLAPASNAH